jgi:2-C-methyl-D-erythritol 4-phosphate cytidylyltransferase
MLCEFVHMKLHYAVLLAGGIGLRMGSALPKQFCNILDKPMIVYPIETYLNIDSVEGIILVLPDAYFGKMTEIIEQYLPNNNKPIELLKCGLIRQESSYNALSHLYGRLGNKEKKQTFVSIHDASRALIDRVVIESIFNEAENNGASFACVRITDTIYKQENEDLFLIPRENLLAAQTPQTFRLPVIYEAHQKARKEGYTSTDDVSLLLHYDIRVIPYVHNTYNPKITYPNDLLLAECYLKSKNRNNSPLT